MEPPTDTINLKRSAFQGVGNIIRFNWHLYAMALLISGGLLLLTYYLPAPWPLVLYIAVLASAGFTFFSLIVSWYIYDKSGLYSLSWLQLPELNTHSMIANIHAGFDETSALLKTTFNPHTLHVFDFYDPRLHTEWSVKRARKAYPPYPGTISISTSSIPLPNASCQVVFLIFAAHEIRNESERIQFFRNLKTLLQPGGVIVVTEHLRDLPNSLAYTLGVFHFYSFKTWQNTFLKAGLTIKANYNINPFVRTFILNTHDTHSPTNR